jgi:hypothetical protein
MTTLFRPVGLNELSLIWDSGMREFPPRLPHQPIFYPVTNVDYAIQIARDWNIKDGSLAGYVTEFEVDEGFISAFEPHTVGSSLHKEFWIPAERLSDFNSALQRTIRVHSAYFGQGFEGFVPNQGSLRGKAALDQFVTMAELFGSDRAALAEEVSVNEKAVFLNFLFWAGSDCAAIGEELHREVVANVLQAWNSSHSGIPLLGRKSL